MAAGSSTQSSATPNGGTAGSTEDARPALDVGDRSLEDSRLEDRPLSYRTVTLNLPSVSTNAADDISQTFAIPTELDVRSKADWVKECMYRVLPGNLKDYLKTNFSHLTELDATRLFTHVEKQMKNYWERNLSRLTQPAAFSINLESQFKENVNETFRFSCSVKRGETTDDWKKTFMPTLKDCITEQLKPKTSEDSEYLEGNAENQITIAYTAFQADQRSRNGREF